MQLSINNLSKSFEENTVLDQLELEIPEGSVFCLLGQNGAGKSTLINLIMQLLQAEEGSIQYDGEAYQSLPDSLKKRIGLLSEDNHLLEELTAYQFLKLSGKMYGLAADILEERINDLADYFFEEGQLKKRLTGFSTGMKKKAGLCAAVLHTPDLLILDEPFSGLDPVAAQQTVDFIKAYQKPQRSVFLASHNLGYIEKVATHIAVLDQGQIVFQGSLQDFTKQGVEKLDEALLNLLKPDTKTLSKIKWI